MRIDYGSCCFHLDNGPCLGWRPAPKSPYVWISYDDVIRKAENTGAGFIQKGLKPLNTTRVGIYSQNKVEVSKRKDYFTN